MLLIVSRPTNLPIAFHYDVLHLRFIFESNQSAYLLHDDQFSVPNKIFYIPF